MGSLDKLVADFACTFLIPSIALNDVGHHPSIRDAMLELELRSAAYLRKAGLECKKRPAAPKSSGPV
jgi:hypothetical protein